MVNIHQISDTYLLVSSDSLGFCCDSEYLEVFYISGQVFVSNISDISLVKNGNAEGKFSVHNIRN